MNMTPEKLITDLKEMGWDCNEYSWNTAVENPVFWGYCAYPIGDEGEEISIEIPLDSNLEYEEMMQEALRVAEPFLKAHRADKALEDIEDCLNGPVATNPRVQPEWHQGYFQALREVKEMLKGEK